MKGRSRRPLGLVAPLVVLTLLGCGVSDQNAPVPLPLQSTSAAPSTPPESNAASVTVYFVQFGRLAPVNRPAPDTTPETALRLLVDGPSRVEAAAGLETALVPQEFGMEPGARGTLTVEAGPEFASIAGDNQLLAVAQLVWTATNHSPRDLVRITVGGQPIEVPTDDGLSRLPVGRRDYATVAPVDEPGAPGRIRPTPAATPS